MKKTIKPTITKPNREIPGVEERGRTIPKPPKQVKPKK